MDKRDIAETRNLPAAELIELIGALQAEELTALRDAEAADATPRDDVLAAIDAAVAKHNDDAGKGGSGGSKSAAVTPPAGGEKKSRGKKPETAEDDGTPEWQRPDYTGPLTIPQGEWRARHIKPVTGVITK